MVALGIGAVDALSVQASDARAEAHADHGEGGEVDLGVAVRIGVVLLEVEVAFVVEHAVEHEVVEAGAVRPSLAEVRPSPQRAAELWSKVVYG